MFSLPIVIQASQLTVQFMANLASSSIQAAFQRAQRKVILRVYGNPFFNQDLG